MPEQFTARIPRLFGEQGRAWLVRLPQLLDRCQERWGLTGLTPSGTLSYNLVCFAESQTYGPVALKIGVPHSELFTEMKALSLYAGRGICTCYDSDPELGALLLERIVPGSDLKSVHTSEERFRIAAGLIGALPLDLPTGHGLPSYADWVHRAFQRARDENRAGPDLLALVDIAAGFFREMDTPDRPRRLLHGDLHHTNILQGRDGAWKAIDPKGVTGVHCLEAGRFMQNEFGMFDPADRLDRLDQMTSIFARELGEEKRLLARCAFVDQVLATCWSVEEEITPDELRKAVAKCEGLLAYSLQSRNSTPLPAPLDGAGTPGGSQTSV